MTLILTRCCERYVVQVSDRLLTSMRGQRPHDRVSNKTIVLLTRDGLLSLSYSGLAYVGRCPSDQWLATTLIGKSYEMWGTPVFSSGAHPRHWQDNGTAIRALADVLGRGHEAVSPRLRATWDKAPFWVSYGGWQWNKRGRVRPVVGMILKKPESRSVALIQDENRYAYLRGGLAVTDVPEGRLRDEEHNRLREVFSARDLETDRIALVDAIRSVAKRDRSVGQDCMSVLLEHPRRLSAVVTYEPTAQETGKIARLTTPDGPISFSPWVITPGGVFPPSILTGGSYTVCAGDFRVTIHGPDRADGLHAVGSQIRAKAP